MPTDLRHLISEASIRAAIYPIVRGLWRSRLDPDGLQELTGPCFLYGNHSNNMDPFLVNWFARFGDVSSGVLTAEYMQGGPVTAAFRGIGLLSTRKRVPEPHLIGRIRRLLHAGRKIMIYPEGGRRWHGRPITWMESTAKVFQRFGFPVHPIVTHGSYVAWPRWATWPRPARIRVTILPPVDLPVDAPLDDILGRLKAPIADDENTPPEDVRPKWAFRPADGIERLLYRDPVTGENGGLFSPDGEHVRNVDGSIRWRMRPDSTLVDLATGETLLTADLYERIRALPLDAAPGMPMVSDLVGLRSGTHPGDLVARGLVRAAIHRDHVVVGTQTISMEDILYSGVERNRKLQITLGDRLIELDFDGRGSALQWDDTLHRLRPEIG